MGKEKKPTLKSLNIDDTQYKTTLTKKFEQRIPWKPNNPKIIRSFIPGTIIKILVKEGDEVKIGDNMLILESMKMENELLAEISGKIKKIHVKKGEKIPKNHLIIEFE